MERVDNPSRSPSKSAALTAVPLLGAAVGQQSSRASRAWSSAQPGAEPLLYTVEEAAALLRISRTLAYEMAGQYVASCGQAGLPVIRLRKRLRVPRWALLELALHGRVVSISGRVAGTGSDRRGGLPRACRPLTIDGGPRPALRKVLGSQSSVAFAREAPCYVVRAVDVGSRQLSRRPHIDRRRTEVPRRGTCKCALNGRGVDPITGTWQIGRPDPAKRVATTTGTHPRRGRSWCVGWSTPEQLKTPLPRPTMPPGYWPPLIDRWDRASGLE